MRRRPAILVATCIAVAAPAIESGDPAGCPDVFSEAYGDAIAARYPGKTVTAHVYDIGTGCTDSIDPHAVVTTASVHKIEILAGILLDAQAEDRRLTDLEEIRARAMIRHSANTEATALRNRIGGRTRMAELDDLFGMEATVATDPWGATPTTAADQVRLARKTLLDEDGPLRPWAVDVMWSMMTNVKPSQHWGISSGVPSGWDVALKNGFYPLGSGAWRVNSSGVVMSPDGRGYAVTILTYGWTSMSPGILAVEKISRHVAKALTDGDPICRRPTIVGTSGDDRLVGTPGRDVIAGRGGDDVIVGRAGDDVMCGGKGSDTIRGGAGRDVLRGGTGRDRLLGGRGDDVLIGGTGRGTLEGRTGRDDIMGGRDADVLSGGKGGDHLHGGGGGDTLDGGGADDLLVGGGGTDSCADPGHYEVWLVWAGCEGRP
jgi:beta-lactamase class A